MESTNVQCKDIQAKLLVLLKNTIDFLDKHNLRWWMAYGSAIGTVRHKGFIPWDDDLDIFMPYEDYVRLLNMKDEFIGTQLALDKPFTDNNCCAYAKIYDTNSTVWQVEEFESIIGLWIDIFPLFKTDMSDQEYWNAVKQYTSLNNRYLGGIRKPKLGVLLKLLKGFHVRSVMDWFKDMTINKLRLNNTIDSFQNYLNSIHNSNGNYYVFPFTYINVLNKFPVKWFEETIEMEFNDLNVKMIGEYDLMLKQLYGDYMTLPPVDKQYSTHSFYCLDLEHSYSKEEILKIKNK